MAQPTATRDPEIKILQVHVVGEIRERRGRNRRLRVTLTTGPFEGWTYILPIGRLREIGERVPAVGFRGPLAVPYPWWREHHRAGRRPLGR